MIANPLKCRLQALGIESPTNARFGFRGVRVAVEEAIAGKEYFLIGVDAALLSQDARPRVKAKHRVADPGLLALLHDGGD